MLREGWGPAGGVFLASWTTRLEIPSYNHQVSLMPHKETQQGALEFAGAEVQGGELICEPQMSSLGCHLFSLAPGFPPLEPEGVTSLMGPRPHGQRGKGNTGAQTQQACGRHFHPSSSPVHQPWPWWIRKAGSAGPFTSVSRPTPPSRFPDPKWTLGGRRGARSASRHSSRGIRPVPFAEVLAPGVRFKPHGSCHACLQPHS